MNRAEAIQAAKGIVEEKRQTMLSKAPAEVRALLKREAESPDTLSVQFGADSVSLVRRDHPGSDAGTVIEEVRWSGGLDYVLTSLQAYAFFGPDLSR